MSIKTAKNSAWSLFEYLWNPLLILITTPFFLRILGSVDFGRWMFLNAAVGFGGILTAGIIPPIIKKISASKAHDNSTSIESTIRGGTALALLGGAITSSLILLVIVFAGKNLLSKMGGIEVIALSGVIVAVVLWIDQFDAVLVATLKGIEKFDKAAKVEVISRTCLYLLAGLLIYLGMGIYSVFVAQVISALIRLSGRFIYVNNSLIITTYRPDFGCLAGILELAKWGWIQGIGGALYSVADRFLIGIIIGASSLAHYTIASQLAIQVQAVMGAALSVVFPIVSRTISAGRTSSLKRITSFTLIGSWIAVSLMCIILLNWRMEILTMWVGKSTADATGEILYYLTVASWIQGLVVAPHFILQGLGMFRFVALSGLIAGATSLVIMFLLMPSHGDVGVGIGRIAYGTVLFVYFVPLIKKVYVK